MSSVDTNDVTDVEFKEVPTEPQVPNFDPAAYLTKAFKDAGFEDADAWTKDIDPRALVLNNGLSDKHRIFFVNRALRLFIAEVDTKDNSTVRMVIVDAVTPEQWSSLIDQGFIPWIKGIAEDAEKPAVEPLPEFEEGDVRVGYSSVIDGAAVQVHNGEAFEVANVTDSEDVKIYLGNYTIRGTVATLSDLPKENVGAGDAYVVTSEFKLDDTEEASGQNGGLVAFTGTHWVTVPQGNDTPVQQATFTTPDGRVVNILGVIETLNGQVDPATTKNGDAYVYTDGQVIIWNGTLGSWETFEPKTDEAETVTIGDTTFTGLKFKGVEGDETDPGIVTLDVSFDKSALTEDKKD